MWLLREGFPGSISHLASGSALLWHGDKDSRQQGAVFYFLLFLLPERKGKHGDSPMSICLCVPIATTERGRHAQTLQESRDLLMELWQLPMGHSSSADPVKVQSFAREPPRVVVQNHSWVPEMCQTCSFSLSLPTQETGERGGGLKTAVLGR